MIDPSVMKKENIQFEAKKGQGGLPRSLWETYSAFANTDGGTIVIGLEEKDGRYEVLGIKNPDVMVKEIWDTLNNRNKVNRNILSDRNIRIEKMDGSDVIVVDVPRGDRNTRPVFINNDMFNGTYMRNGEGDYHCSREQILEMVRDSEDVPDDMKIIESLDEGSLNKETVNRYRAEYKANNRNSPLNRLPDDEFLELIGALGKDGGSKHPTAAGLLAFGRGLDIVKVFPQFFLDCRIFEDDTMDWSDRICSYDYDTSNIFDFFTAVSSRVEKWFPIPFKLNGMTRVKETPAYIASRELILNSLLHADYHGRLGVVVEKRPNNLTISNPGRFRIPLERAEKGGNSDPRNPSLFRIFGLIGLIERAGTGIYRARKEMSDAGMKAPVFREESDPSRVVATVDLRKGMIDIRSEILKMIREDENISISDMMGRTGLSKARLVGAINYLKEEGTIVREGSSHGGRWVIPSDERKA